MNQLLTDKCLEDFRDFLLKWIKENIAWNLENPSKEDVDHFFTFPTSMQYGVYQDFSDSKGFQIDINTNYQAENYKGFSFEIFSKNGLKHYDSCSFSNTRNEAREESIKAFNQYYNDKS